MTAILHRWSSILVSRSCRPPPPASRRSASRRGWDRAGQDWRRRGIRTLDRALQPYDGLANRRLSATRPHLRSSRMPDAGRAASGRFQARPIPGSSAPPGCDRSPPSRGNNGIDLPSARLNPTPARQCRRLLVAIIKPLMISTDLVVMSSRQRRHGSSSSFRNDV